MKQALPLSNLAMNTSYVPVRPTGLAHGHGTGLSPHPHTQMHMGMGRALPPPHTQMHVGIATSNHLCSGYIMICFGVYSTQEINILYLLKMATTIHCQTLIQSSCGKQRYVYSTTKKSLHSKGSNFWNLYKLFTSAVLR